MSNDEMDAHLGLQIGNLDLQSALQVEVALTLTLTLTPTPTLTPTLTLTLQSSKPIDEPPPGWTVDQRETSTGRKYKVSGT